MRLLFRPLMSASFVVQILWFMVTVTEFNRLKKIHE